MCLLILKGGIIALMTYRLYIYIITQLATRKFVVLPIGNKEILFRIDEEDGEWKVSLKITDLSKKGCSKQIQECFSSRSKATFFQGGSELVIDCIEGPGVYLVKRLKPSNKYMFFRDVIDQLLQEADDFKDLFCVR